MKIFIADSQSRVRYGLRVLLEQQPGWMVIGEAGDTQELLTQFSHHSPDLLLLDWELTGMPAAILLPRLRKAYPALKVISISGHDEFRHAALSAGSDSFVSKIESPEKLIALIHELYVYEIH
jgi:DNA-binding NarL/FixJ family response regulator